ncbi:MAG: DHH family phosphoesterase [Candidatus Marinimicrobia bacterium]|nr:DHH family phosphoesterase [Candidatus Neomarinimicrobiota bacterium]
MSFEYYGERRDWELLTKLLREHESFVFSTHVQPDADGVGSELGLARFLKKMGKTVHIFNPSPLRANLGFLTQSEEIQVYESKLHRSIVAGSDIFIAFDIGHYNRLMELGHDLKSMSIPKISIDHHPGDKSDFDVCFNFSTASSTGILIYDLIAKMDDTANSTYEIAYPIYAAMMSDTGNFRYNNTDPETLMAAARLVSVGVKPYELYVYLYEDLNTPGRLRLLNRLIEDLKYDCDGRLAWSVIDFEEVSKLGAVPDDMNSLSDFVRSIKGVEIGVSLTQMPGKTVDISMRSKGRIAINMIAEAFGGGGHAFAAGCHFDGTLAEAAAAIAEKCKATIIEWDKNA